MTAYRVFCSSCETSTIVHMSRGALGAVANCECGRSFFASQEADNLKRVSETEAHR